MAELTVCRAEGITPFGDAVGLVHYDVEDAAGPQRGQVPFREA